MTSVLVTGATGKQGGSVIKNLLEKNAPFKILAVTRDVNSASAKKTRPEIFQYHIDPRQPQRPGCHL